MSARAIQFLNEVEAAEAGLLSWGIVDGFWTEEELGRKAEAFIARAGAEGEFSDGRDLLEHLESENLFTRWQDGGQQRYRTRMAETLRLMALLRQLFPKHLREESAWLSAPTLVSDFRFLPKRRQLARRDMPAQEALSALTAGSDALRLSAIQVSATQAILGFNDPERGPTQLAGFQVRAFKRLLNYTAKPQPNQQPQGSSGTVICAGTGSGKTLAFYLPTLVHLVGSIERDAAAWVRSITLYPRNELLKDQFTEVLSLVLTVNQILQGFHLRGIRIGAYFGDTPRTASSLRGDGSETGPWERVSGGWVCPYLRCVASNCQGNLIWREADQAQNVERLCCNSCNLETDARTVALTRQGIIEMPPDIVFTTTEMLNQRMSDSRVWHLFGIGKRTSAATKPSIVLLDEVHTYDGHHGAQVAGLLRRWRHRSGSSPHFVGLSATLMEAASFFSQMTGVPESRIEEVSPEQGELIEEGAEYQVAIRGDPVSGASLLSATIQAAMLLKRSLDVETGGLFGKKVFVFTDDLDVTNRLYFNLMDAEGLNSQGRPDLIRHPGGSLANLRSSEMRQRDLRRSFGQWWRMAEDIGHDLQAGITGRVGRVSSQDSGVDSEADIIVATSALEVGFNDPEVGAVIQHKAPRGAASFLQRKGRAGRRREMRPWTLVLLSDYGRDRLTYQSFDVLFDPELRPKSLPVNNRHVLKMQAALACLDWLAVRMEHCGEGHVWAEVSAPISERASNPSRNRRRRGVEALKDVLAGGSSLDDLTQWLQRSLNLSTVEEVELLLWEPPRSIMAGVLPTLLRRWEKNWMRGTEPEKEYHVFWHPLPEFTPATLFGDLLLPDVQIWKKLQPGDEDTSDSLSITQALREFAPGRISKRFGIRHRLSRHWIALDLNVPEVQALSIEDFCDPGDFEELGVFRFKTNDETVREIRTVRPLGFRVRDDAPRDIADSSHAFPIWSSQLLPPAVQNSGVTIDLPSQSGWNDLTKEIRFFLHRDYAPARIRRFTSGSHATIRTISGVESKLQSSFTVESNGGREPVALGFELEADAVKMRIKFPEDWALSGPKLRALRVSRFKWKVEKDGKLSECSNVFQRRWLAEIALTAAVSLALQESTDLQTAWKSVLDGTHGLKMEDVLEVIFQSLPEEGDGHVVEQRRATELRQLLNMEEVRDALERASPVLWEQPDATWDEWLRQKFIATLGSALIQTAQQMCPDEDIEGDVVVDVDSGVPEEDDLSGTIPANHADIWLSETNPGGGGLVERWLPKLAEDPRRFFDLLKSAIDESDFEMAGAELERLLEIIRAGDSDVVEAIARIRTILASGHTGLEAAFVRLREVLRAKGLRTNHDVVAMLAGRILRPGSSPGTDAFMVSAVDDWRNAEEQLGVEVEARNLAYSLSAKEDLDSELSGATGLPPASAHSRRQWRCNAIASMLWPRGTIARNQSLTIRNQYSETLTSERLLIADIPQPREAKVEFNSEGWLSEVREALRNSARVVLWAETALSSLLRKALTELMTVPVDAGTMLFYPRLRAVRRQANNWYVTLELTAPVLMGPPEEGDSSEWAGPVTRMIVKTAQGGREEVRDLLQSLLAVYLLDPRGTVWLVSPWISDLPIIDNRAGAYDGLEPAWPKRYLTLSEVFAFILRNCDTSHLRIVTRPDKHNQQFLLRLRRLTDLDRTTDRLKTSHSREVLHIKGLLAEDFVMNGSMNFTKNGVEIFDEMVTLEANPSLVASMRLEFERNYLSSLS